MKIYGYVNRYKGETEDFLNNREFDEIIYCDNDIINLSFLESGDTIILFSLKSITKNLKEMLNFVQFVFDNEIEVHCADKKDDKYDDFIDTNKAIGKMMIGLWASLNRFDDEFYRNVPNGYNIKKENF